MGNGEDGRGNRRLGATEWLLCGCEESDER
jgi:hypothetical protein